jgi:uncharacterized protein YbbC (DUF1343 family)
MKTGLDRIVSEPKLISGLGRVGLVTHQAVTTSTYVCAADAVYEASKRAGGTTLTAIFGPQHGYGQTEQDNMFETPDTRFHFRDGHSVSLYSLYSKTREPLPEQMREIDTLLVDMPDIGCRVYTYIQTLANCILAAEKQGKQVVVLDRPNPIGLSHRTAPGGEWKNVEGNRLEMRFESFVGCCPIPLRHGLTLGEFGHYFLTWKGSKASYRVITCEGLHRDTPLATLATEPFVFPSPNMPTWLSALLFPGFVVLEATNISEGRGTTIPFQLFGSPWQNSRKLADFLYAHCDPNGTAMHLRSHSFRPTFNKHKGEVCNGIQIHPLQYEGFPDFALGIWLLMYNLANHTGQFLWKDPGYEYNFSDPPYLLVLGDERWRTLFTGTSKSGLTPDTIENCRSLLGWAHSDAQRFAEENQEIFLYKNR